MTPPKLNRTVASSLLNLAGKAPVKEGPAKVQPGKAQAQNTNKLSYSRPANQQAAQVKRSPTIARITSKANNQSGSIFSKLFGGSQVGIGNQINSKA